MEIPADLKYITPYVQRGQELMARDPVVSYYGKYFFKLRHKKERNTILIVL